MANPLVLVHSSSTWFIILVQKNHRNVSLKDDTYETLKRMGDVTESFDDVVKRLLKAASAPEALGGTEAK
jgi:hypothetical protein